MLYEDLPIITRTKVDLSTLSQLISIY